MDVVSHPQIPLKIIPNGILSKRLLRTIELNYTEMENFTKISNGYLVTVPNKGTYFLTNENCSNTVQAKNTVLRKLGLFSERSFIVCIIVEV